METANITRRNALGVIGKASAFVGIGASAALANPAQSKAEQIVHHANALIDLLADHEADGVSIHLTFDKGRIAQRGGRQVNYSHHRHEWRKDDRLQAGGMWVDRSTYNQPINL